MSDIVFYIIKKIALKGKSEDFNLLPINIKNEILMNHLIIL